MSEERIYVHSAKRTDGSSYNFSYPLRHQISGVKKVAIKDITIVNSFANINNGNNAISFVYDLTTYNVFIPVGDYSVIQLITEIKNQLPASVAITYSNITNKITIDAGLGHTINLDAVNTNTLGSLIGMTVTDAPADRYYVSSGFVDISPRKSIYIYSSINTGSQLNGKKNQILSRIVLSQDYGVITVANTGNEKDWIKIPPQELSGSLQISIRDDDGNILDNGGYEWEMVLITSQE